MSEQSSSKVIVVIKPEENVLEMRIGENLEFSRPMVPQYQLPHQHFDHNPNYQSADRTTPANLIKASNSELLTSKYP